MKVAIYREARRSEYKREAWMSRPQPTRIKVLEAEDVEHGLAKFVNQLPDKGGWDKYSHIMRSRYRGTVWDLWIRRFTPTGQYKGETHFFAQAAV